MDTPLAQQVEKLEKELIELKEKLKNESPPWIVGGVYALKGTKHYYMLTCTSYDTYDLHNLCGAGTRYYGNFKKEQLQKCLNNGWEFVSESPKQFILSGGKF